MRKLLSFRIPVLFVALVVLAPVLFAQGPGGHHAPPFFSQLTVAQRTHVRDTVQEMRQAGATAQEVRQAIEALLDQWGIELTERPGGPLTHIMTQLTEEQRTEVRELVQEMHASGATQAEIREAVAALLREFGVELPPPGGLRPEFRHIMAQLTPGQRSQVRQTIRRMRRAGSSPQEIRNAVQALLEQFGIELPGDGPSVPGSGDVKIRARNYPNPFNPDTRITYSLSSPEKVQVAIYNVAGQLVRSFDMGYQTDGTHSVKWDGFMENGQKAPSGLYVYRIRAGQISLTQRMLLVK